MKAMTMKAMMMTKMTRIRALLKGTKGASVSLSEASITIAIGATLAVGVATIGSGTLVTARELLASEQTQAIGQAVLSFYQDNVIYPAYEDGSATGPADTIFQNLASRDGNYPTDSTSTWDVGVTAVTSANSNLTAATFGHHVETTSDSIENHLRLNTPGGDAANEYPARGSGAFGSDDQRGWDGPYLEEVPVDPWGTKFLINIQELNVGHLSTTHGGVDTIIAVLVISAGANREIETSAVQVINGGNVVVAGDDIVFRIR